MESFEELKRQAESLELEGREVAEYIKAQQQAARAERALERDLERLNHERELEKGRLHNELEKLRLDHELALAQLEQAPGVVTTPVHVEKPKLPRWTEGEDLPSYFIRFERIASLLNLDRASLAIRLGSSLSGKAADIYSSLSPEITADYDQLKGALFLGFNKTPDSLRKDFRSSKLGEGETYQQFVISLGRKLDYWIDSVKLEKNFDALREFLILDQLISNVSPELRIFLKEKGQLTLKDAALFADNWTTARPMISRHQSGRDNVKKQSLNSVRIPYRESFVRIPDHDSKARLPISPNKSAEAPKRVNIKNVTCHNCGVLGHYRSECPMMKASRPGASANYSVGYCLNDQIGAKYMSFGTINGANVSTIVRDTGCSCVIVASDVLPDLDLTNARKVSVSDFLGRISIFPVAKCYLKCDFYDGWIDAVIAPIKCCSVLVGNVPGVKDRVNVKSDPILKGDTVTKSVDVHQPKDFSWVATRAQSKRQSIHPLKVADISSLDLTPPEFARHQKNCPSLSKLWEKAEAKEISRLRDGSEFTFVVENDLLYRKCLKSPNQTIVGRQNVVLPEICRPVVLSTAHESPVAGHFSHNKTLSKIATKFFWPGASVDVRNFCRSCDSCQRMSQRRTKPVPLVKMPIISVPFSRVSMDIVGPLIPASAEGHKYILTLIDWATGFPEAVPLKTIDSISVAESLLTIFSRVGIPNEILSDQGSNFTSRLMEQLHKLLGVKPLFSSIYHAAGNGRQERLHSTLKSSLRKLCERKPRDWHRYLVATLFALRELPSDRTGFSPFELLYGRQVRGPIAVLHDLWTDREISDDQRGVFQYILDLRKNLEECAEIAKINSEAAQTKFSTYFDLKAKDRHLSPDDEALVLLPDSTSKLLMGWKGPFRVIKRLSRVNYLLQCGQSTNVYHINLLKRYVRRAGVTANATTVDEPVETVFSGGTLFCAHAVVLDESIVAPADVETESKISLVKNPNIITVKTRCLQVSKPTICKTLDDSQRNDMGRVIAQFSGVLSELPGHTKTVSHSIKLKTTAPVRSKVYPIPFHLRSVFDEEVDSLLKLGIIQRSSSEFCSPVVLVKKPDESYRITIDYRALNSVSRFDAEPAFNLEDDFHRFSGSKFFSEIDITKAYYQVELDADSRPLTAFPTNRGLMEYTRLPFGLLTACATYARLMRIVLADIENVTFYFDNILVFTKNWLDHIKTLNAVFLRLQSHGLTANPSKCKFGFPTIEYLGFVISERGLAPQKTKVTAMVEAKPPTTKKGLRSFLGFVSFYRRFIPNLSNVTASLGNLLKKTVKEPLCYGDQETTDFLKLRNILTEDPILRLPDMSKPFVVRSDSSNNAVGGVLLQYFDNVPCPIAFASRKLTSSETKFATVERECLALVFAVQRFSVYLLGQPFILEVDHRPLVYLNKMKNINSRLTRWALSLQPYNYTVVYLPGSENVGADYLSRSFE